MGSLTTTLRYLRQNKVPSTQVLTQSELPKSVRDASFFCALEMSNRSSGRAYNQGIGGLRPNQKFQVSKLAAYKAL